MILHKDYDGHINPDWPANDLALVRVHGALPGSAVIPPAIVLPSPTSSAGKALEATGWGRTSATEKKGSDQLMMVELPIVDAAMCKAVYGSKIKAGMFCAGYLAEEKDTCGGDSGGPLTARDPSRPAAAALVGVTSWGAVVCGSGKKYGVYSSVPYHLSWIRGTIASE